MGMNKPGHTSSHTWTSGRLCERFSDVRASVSLLSYLHSADR